MEQTLAVNKIETSTNLFSEFKILESPKYGFLDKNDERFLIAIPWIGAALTVGLWLVAKVGYAFQITDLPVLLSTLLFLDSVHILFTFTLMLSSPELRAWNAAPGARAKTGWMKGLSPWARTFVIAIALGIVIYLLKAAPYVSTLKGMATMWLFLELLGPAHHTLAQMRGISLVYNSTLKKNIEFSASEKTQALRCEKLERLFFNLLLAGEIFYWIPTIFGMDKLEVPGMDTIRFVGGILAVGSATALVVNSLYFPHQEKSRKFAFIFRVLLFPLKMLSIVGGIFVRAAHGTEYLIIFRKMAKSSNMPKPKKKHLFMMTIGVSLAYLIPYVLTWPNVVKDVIGYSVSDSIFAAAIVGTFTLRFTHYYLDAVMFKMSDPTTRLAVSPLLASNQS